MNGNEKHRQDKQGSSANAREESGRQEGGSKTSPEEGGGAGKEGSRKGTGEEGKREAAGKDSSRQGTGERGEREIAGEENGPHPHSVGEKHAQADDRCHAHRQQPRP
ncbi:MAG: hypothetical protein RBT86_00595 [Azospira sp.]|nr:hypothetical protein [Azospira sp.]